MKLIPTILCGGSGTRLWPLSRSGFPKQFLSLTGNISLFQQAVERLSALVAPAEQASTLVLTNEEHRFLALEQLREVSASASFLNSRLILEPMGRNTAPALTFAALQATLGGEDAILLVSPADQTIQNIEAFTTALKHCIAVAATGAIAILGIQPSKPETGYGYIKRAGAADANAAFAVDAFVEKPDLATAQKYLDSGDYLWNSGMFVLRASVWLDALRRFRPDIEAACVKAWTARKEDAQFIRPEPEAFSQIPSESIDYAVMEKCPGSDIPIRMVALDAGWSDLGSWDAVWQVGTPDAAGNCTTGDAILVDSKDSFVHASSRLVAMVGVSDLVVVETADAVLVADKSRSQDVKKIVERLGTEKREEKNLHRKVQRPWGWYDSIDEDARFKVKRIQVNPGASLSLQKHFHRAEHWIVVKGTAEITCGDQVMVLSENQSTYIPLGEVHRLTNPGTIPLEIIEIQSGSYLGEDDIVRFEDTYGRS